MQRKDKRMKKCIEKGEKMRKFFLKGPKIEEKRDKVGGKNRPKKANIIPTKKRGQKMKKTEKKNTQKNSKNEEKNIQRPKNKEKRQK